MPGLIGKIFVLAIGFFSSPVVIEKFTSCMGTASSNITLRVLNIKARVVEFLGIDKKYMTRVVYNPIYFGLAVDRTVFSRTFL